MNYSENDFNSNILDNLFKDQPTKNNKASTVDEIILIVDISGSMWSIQQDAEGGINSFINEQKTVGEANLTIVEFDDKVSVFCERENIKESKEYKLVPKNSTALYDAIGFTLANAESLNPTGKVIVAIVTDGGENASREYTREVVFSRITSLTEKGWEFLFLSADKDAFGTGAGLGIGKGQTVSFTASGQGASAAYNAINTYALSSRSGSSRDDATEMLRSYVSSNDGVEQED